MKLVIHLSSILLLTASAFAQQWTEPVRGSWISDGADGLVLVEPGLVVDIVVSPDAHSAVQQAAEFLARDIEKLSGQTPAIAPAPGNNNPFIRLATIGKDDVPADGGFQSLEGKWEGYRVQTLGNGVWLVGSNPRGTAFAAYTLSERLGVDPLYHWTGYEPDQHDTLAMKRIDFSAGEPTFKYRGLFHDDEDILPREVDKNGYPVYAGGTIDPVWYERYFETALRLRMNQVAPFVRTRRPYEVRKTASDWGLFYSSHHYDILLSNPFGYDRFGLAAKRGVEGEYNWAENREGILKYWRAGVEENKNLDCIWPVGLRGTADTSYRFPKGTTQEEKNKVFTKAIRDTVEMAKQMLPEGKDAVFHFTMYGEMLGAFRAGTLALPEDVILVWNDTGDGKMRALPKELGEWKHGIYYHLAYYGRTTKQTHHTITPTRIEEQFRKIVDAGATEYLLVNVSEVREHVMNARFIAEIAWDADTAFSKPDAAGRYVNWWSGEYFGEAAAKDVADTYRNYFDILHSHDQLWEGALGLDKALYLLRFRLAGDHHIRPGIDDREALGKLRARASRYEEALATAERAEAEMSEQQAHFFYDNAMFGMLIDYRPTQAAVLLYEALSRFPDERAIEHTKMALKKLEQLEQETRRAERPPFENWFKATWIRRHNSLTNVHYSINRLREYLANYEPRYK